MNEIKSTGDQFYVSKVKYCSAANSARVSYFQCEVYTSINLLQLQDTLVLFTMDYFTPLS